MYETNAQKKGKQMIDGQMNEKHILYHGVMFHLTPIPINPNYGITKDGVVWNLKRNWPVHGSINADGYRIVALSGPHGVRKRAIHRLLYLTFIGPIDPRQKIKYINGDKIDDRVENITLAGPKPRKKYARKKRPFWDGGMIATGIIK